MPATGRRISPSAVIRSGTSEANVAAHQWRGTDELDVEQPADQAPAFADLEHVAKSLGGDQSGLRTLALEQRVRGDGGAVHERDDGSVLDTERFERIQHATPLLTGE